MTRSQTTDQIGPWETDAEFNAFLVELLGGVGAVREHEHELLVSLLNHLATWEHGVPDTSACGCPSMFALATLVGTMMVNQAEMWATVEGAGDDAEELRGLAYNVGANARIAYRARRVADIYPGVTFEQLALLGSIGEPKVEDDDGA